MARYSRPVGALKTPSMSSRDTGSPSEERAGRWGEHIVSRAEQIGGIEAEFEEQSDFDKIRRIPYLYAFNIITAAALLCTVTAPLALFAAELGVPKDRIGLIGGIMPFVQV